MLPYFLIIICGFLVAGGVGLLMSSLKVRGWPTTQGHVIERGVGPATTTGGSRPGRYFEPRVKYTYSVDGKTYTGDRIDQTRSAYGEDQAQRKVSELPDTVKVYYNPQAPTEAYLKATAFGVAAMMLGGGIIGFLVGIGLLIAKRG